MYKSLAVLFLVLLCGCSAGITRYGYELQNLSDPNSSTECCIAIKQIMTYDQADVEIMGSIKAYDTSLSIRCSEAYVLSIFLQDACALGADVINITEVKYPDLWSTCYRAKAEFLYFKNREQAKNIFSDSQYTPELIFYRSGRYNSQAMETGIMTSIAIGTSMAVQ